MRVADLFVVVLCRAARVTPLATLAIAGSTIAAAADWSSVPVIEHKTYQAVAPGGDSAYSGAFPIRLIGVVLNNNEDWVDPASNYCTTAGHLWDMGGQAEIYVQAVNLDGTVWDPDLSAFDDHAGTSCWMGQNYGNHIWHYSEDQYSTESLPWNYTEGNWYSELDRLGFYYPGTLKSESQLVCAGDLVEISAQNGLYYEGKMNVNEHHNNTPGVDLEQPMFDFEIAILQKGYGLPDAAEITLSEIKDANNIDIFDPAGDAGGEYYQSSLVTIKDVCLATTAGWGTNADLTLTDATGRTLPIHLGLNDSFSTTPALTGYFNVTGILDQLSDSGMDGYRLLAMDAGSFVAVPEPATIVLLIAAAAAALCSRIVHQRRRTTA